MSFLGAVTQLDGSLVRPHDVELGRPPGTGAVAGRIARIVRVGFEVRVDVVVGTGTVQAVLTRSEARALGVAEGGAVWLRTAPGSVTIPVLAAAAPPADLMAVGT